MFRKTRIKIIVAIMGSLVILFAATLAVVYHASSTEVSQSNSDNLKRYSDRYLLESPDEDRPAPPGENNHQPPEPRGEKKEEVPPGSGGDNPPSPGTEYELSTFYSVAFSKNGEVLKIDNGDDDIYSDDQLVEIASEILKGKTEFGTKGTLCYIVDRRPNFNLVAFLDNTLAQSSLDTLLHNMILTGCGAIAVLFFISLILSEMIIRPLEENDRKQKQFISDASHELKTPISVIGANAEMLGRGIGENEWLENIKYENERMGTLVKQLLDLSRTGSSRATMSVVDFSRIATGEVLAFESLAFDMDKTIISDIEEDISVNGNSSQLQQLVSVLLDNAIKHSTGKNIEVSLKKHGRNAVLTVSNESGEIPGDKLAHLFDRFYRIDDVRNSSSQHYGLGLAIAKAVSESHKGSISASFRDGRICFTATIPKN